MHKSVTVHRLCAPQNAVDHVGSHARAPFSPPQTILQVTFCTRSFPWLAVALRDSPKRNYIETSGRARQCCLLTYQKQMGNSSGSAQEFRLNSSHLPSPRLKATPHQPTPVFVPYHIKIHLLLLHTIYFGFPASPSATLHASCSPLHCMEPCLPHIKTQL